MTDESNAGPWRPEEAKMDELRKDFESLNADYIVSLAELVTQASEVGVEIPRVVQDVEFEETGFYSHEELVARTMNMPDTAGNLEKPLATYFESLAATRVDMADPNSDQNEALEHFLPHLSLLLGRVEDEASATALAQLANDFLAQVPGEQVIDVANTVTFRFIDGAMEEAKRAVASENRDKSSDLRNAIVHSLGEKAGRAFYIADHLEAIELAIGDGVSDEEFEDATADDVVLLYRFFDLQEDMEPEALDELLPRLRTCIAHAHDMYGYQPQLRLPPT